MLKLISRTAKWAKIAIDLNRSLENYKFQFRHRNKYFADANRAFNSADLIFHALDDVQSNCRETVLRQSRASDHQHRTIAAAKYINLAEPSTHHMRAQANANRIHISHHLFFFSPHFFPQSFLLYCGFVSSQRKKTMRTRETRSNRKSINPLFKRFRFGCVEIAAVMARSQSMACARFSLCGIRNARKCAILIDRRPIAASMRLIRLIPSVD